MKIFQVGNIIKFLYTRIIAHIAFSKLLIPHFVGQNKAQSQRENNEDLTSSGYHTDYDPSLVFWRFGGDEGVGTYNVSYCDAYKDGC